MSTSPFDLSLSQQLFLLRQLARTYALNFDWEQPTVSGVSFIDACLLCWSLDEIGTLDHLEELDRRFAVAMVAFPNLYSSNDGYMGDFFLRYQRLDKYERLDEWISSLVGRCTGKKRAQVPTANQISHWITRLGELDTPRIIRSTLIERGSALKLYCTVQQEGRPDTRGVGQFAKRWPVPPTMMGVCAYFEALFEYGTGYSSPLPPVEFLEQRRGMGASKWDGQRTDRELEQAAAVEWGATLVEMRLNDCLSWLDIQRISGLTDEIFDPEALS